MGYLFRRRANQRAARPSWRPTIERLEDRTVPVIGTFTPLASQDPIGVGTMLLLNDGTVMACSAGVDNEWFQLKPAANGSYANSTWTQVASMNFSRLYDFSGVLPNGNLFVAGGEYSNNNGGDTAEIYNPQTNTWTVTSQDPYGDLGDIEGMVMMNGQVVLATRFDGNTRIYNATTDTWTFPGPFNPFEGAGDEQSFTLLPGNNILTVNVGQQAAQILSQTAGGLGSWSAAANPPIQLWDSGFEIGPTVLLYSGKTMTLGSADPGNTAGTVIYNPTTNTFVQGPNIPNGMVADDAPACVMSNGHVLFVADSGGYSPPTSMFEYDPVANTMTNVPLPPAFANDFNPSFTYRMLQLPNGQVLVSDGGGQAYVYTPAGGPAASWRPTITLVSGAGTTFTVHGTQLDGRTEGAYYGDDVSMSTNYPLVRLVNSSGKVFYCATTNNNPGEVFTGTQSMSATFTLPHGLPKGTYSLFVVTNGIPSNKITFTVNNNVPGPAAPPGAMAPFSSGGDTTAPNGNGSPNSTGSVGGVSASQSDNGRTTTGGSNGSTGQTQMPPASSGIMHHIGNSSTRSAAEDTNSILLGVPATGPDMESVVAAALRLESVVTLIV